MSIRLNEDQLRKAFLEHTGRAASASQECLSEGLLIRAAAREIGREAREHVASHLAVCTTCVRNYRIVHSVKGWAEETLPLAGEEASKSILDRDSRPGLIPARRHPREWYRRSIFRQVPGYALAASMIVAALLGGLFVFLHRE